MKDYLDESLPSSVRAMIRTAGEAVGAIRVSGSTKTEPTEHETGDGCPAPNVTLYDHRTHAWFWFDAEGTTHDALTKTVQAALGTSWTPDSRRTKDGTLGIRFTLA